MHYDLLAHTMLCGVQRVEQIVLATEKTTYINSTQINDPKAFN
jgi:hypothetical protein